MSKTTPKKATRAKKAVAKKSATRTTRRTSAPRKPAARKPATTRVSPGSKTAPPRTALPKVAAPKAARPKAAKPAAPRLPADLKLAIACAQDKQAQDVTVLDLRAASAFTDFFLICTGTNTRQVQAIADAIQAGLKAEGQPPALVEGYNRGEWILLDYFTFIVHVFLPSQRAFYALERLWGGAEPIEVSAS